MNRVLLSLVMASAMTVATPGMALNFLVDSAADRIDSNPGDGFCRTALGECTLRAAVMEANATSGAHRISLPAGIYELTLPGADEDYALSGDLDSYGNITIIGDGAESTIIKSVIADRVLHQRIGQLSLQSLSIRDGQAISFGGGVFTESGALRLTNITISNNVVRGTSNLHGGGLTIGTGATVLLDGEIKVSNNLLTRTGDNLSFGGGIANYGRLNSTPNTLLVITDNVATDGGGIFNRSSFLHLNNAWIYQNTATRGGGIHFSRGSEADQVQVINSNIFYNYPQAFSFAYGGGIYVNVAARERVVIHSSTIAFHSFGDDPIGAGNWTSGGGVYNNGGHVIIERSTISSNSAIQDGGGIFQSDALAPGAGTPRLTVTASTITNNVAADGGGIQYNSPTTLGHTVLAGNFPNCDGYPGVRVVSLGYNFTDVGCLNSIDRLSTDIITSIDPLLEPLGFYGGASLTHLPSPGSLLIDKIPSGSFCTITSTDQRGISRPQGVACDIGSVEREQP